MKYSHLGALFLISAATFVNAQDARFGLQATLSKPQGDMGDANRLDGKLGYGLGLQISVDLKGGLVIVPRFDYTTYKRSASETTHYPVVDLTLDTELKASILYVGADFNYYTNGKSNIGFYLLAGLGYSSGKFETTITGKAQNEYGNITNIGISDSTTSGAFYIAAGAGYSFNKNIGTEIRYIGLNKYSDNGTDMASPSLNISLVARF